MVDFTYSGNENTHEIHFKTDDYEKFSILMGMILDMRKGEKGEEPKTGASKKPKFRFEDYKNGCFCMCCKSNKDYENFNEAVEMSGRENCGYPNTSEHNPMCLYFNEGCHGTLGFAQEEDKDNPTILYYEDFDWSDYNF